ncbi:hypothetical protein AMAG_18243 [Allomyces macrogynus ATCC 38327]|uniref:Uncharacterized protein n=1 Tax=Allomyces macrogynus (strain ATCC 38327) TaxID=578462 RepID=A0A0L0S7S6_ALLM3|nr:hypothetical protein AMAG_18243 [Allomyces macrogynus ATCC 38327]|eukprot:KNE58419.1 hypothetical protein AMAG_18243 [Allomyces macrogynus ATCC 38327]
MTPVTPEGPAASQDFFEPLRFTTDWAQADWVQAFSMETVGDMGLFALHVPRLAYALTLCHVCRFMQWAVFSGQTRDEDAHAGIPILTDTQRLAMIEHSLTTLGAKEMYMQRLERIACWAIVHAHMAPPRAMFS